MDVQKTIEQAPGKMARLAQQAEDERIIYQRTKEEVKRSETRIYLSIKAEDTGKTVKELDAEVTQNAEVYSGRLDLIDQEGKYRKIEAEFNSWGEALNAAKMLAKMKMAEIKGGL